jgi:hypothetical protein
MYALADAIRCRLLGAERLRRAAIKAGDSPAAWDALALAARFERDGLRIELQLDERMA